MIAETLHVASCAVRRAFAWWLTELQGMVPDRLRRAWHRKRPRLVLTYRDGELRGQATGGDEGALGSSPAIARRRPQATLCLGPDQSLRTTLDLPIAARDDLGQLLYFEMDRLTPFQADELYFAYRVTGTDQERRRLAVAVHLAPRRLVDGACEAARRHGIEVNRVELSNADDGADPAPNLLPADPAKRGPSRVSLCLALLAVVMAVAAVVIPLQQQRSAAAALERQVAAARAKAEKILALRERLQMIEARQTIAIERKMEAPMVTRLIAELTRLIPDQAYVTQLHVRDDTMQVHGYAEAASELITALARSDLLHEPQFRSPVTRDPDSALERFHISMHLGQRSE